MILNQTRDFIVLLFVFLMGSSGFAQQQTVTFHVEGLSEDSVTVGYYFGEKRYAVDTLSVTEGGNFRLLSDPPQKPGMYFLYADNFYFEFAMDTVSFSLSTRKGGGYETVEVEGSQEVKVFKRLRMALEELQSKQKQYVSDLNSGNLQDSLAARDALALLDVELQEVRGAIVKEYPESFTAAFIGLMKDPEVPTFDSIGDDRARALARYRYYKQHYFDHVDLGDPRLLRTPLLHGKVIKYFDEVITQQPDSINREIDRLFREIGDDAELFRYWLVTLFQKYEKSNLMGMDAVVIHLIENYYLSDQADWITEEFEKKLREEVAFVKPNLIGKPAPPLNVVDTLLQPFYLEQVEQPFVVLYFYDPDCGHCKKATKALKEEYSELIDMGTEVLGVCTITDVSKWKKYIEENDLPWLHAADPYGESRFRVTYNVRSTPKVYVLGPNRKIVAKQLEVKQLKEVISRMQQ